MSPLRAALVPAVTALGCLGAPEVLANPADLFGLGLHAQAMAGTGASYRQGSESTYGNPALLSHSTTQSLQLGWQFARFSVEASDFSSEISRDAAPGVHLGVVLPLALPDPLRERFVLGLAFLTPKDLVTRARLLRPNRPQFPLLSPRANTLSFNLALGVRIGGGFSLGIGLLASAGLVGQIDVLTDDAGDIATVVDDELIATFAPIAGVAWHSHPMTQVRCGANAGARGWGLGLVYRGALKSDFDLRLTASDLGALTLPPLEIAGVAQYSPEQLQFEANHRFDAWQVAGSILWRRWSAFPGWLKPTVRCPSEQPDCAALAAPDVSVADTFSPRLGVALDLERRDDLLLELRAGYAYEPTPLAVAKGASRLWDNDRHVIGAGTGLYVRRPLEGRVEVAFQHHHLVAREHPGGAPSTALGTKTRGSAQLVSVIFGVGF